MAQQHHEGLDYLQVDHPHQEPTFAEHQSTVTENAPETIPARRERSSSDSGDNKNKTDKLSSAGECLIVSLS